MRNKLPEHILSDQAPVHPGANRLISVQTGAESEEMMKKLLALILAMLLLCSAACADSLERFVERWNKAAPVSGTPEIDGNAYTEEVSESYTFKGDGWWFRVCFDNGTLFYAEIHARETDVFQALCVTMGSAAELHKTSEEFTQYEGNLLHNYLRVVADKDSYHFLFGIFTCWIEKDDTGLWFFMDEE